MQINNEKDEKRISLFYRLLQTLSYFVRFFSAIVFYFSLLSCLLIVLIVLVDRYFTNSFFTSQIINLIIASGFPLETFLPAIWLANFNLDSVVIVVIVSIILIVIKKTTITVIYKRIETPIKKIIACFINLGINLLIIISIIMLFFNMMLVSYIDSALEGDSTKQNYSYTERMQFFKERLSFTNKKAEKELKEIIKKVEDKEIVIDYLNDKEYIALASKVAILIDQKQGVNNSKEHYFRNYFTRAPKTLDEMINTINNNKNDLFKWELVPPNNSKFHMFGRNGEYNLKFISANGLFEAVYNLKGELLTEENDPDNMGTFNYADSKQVPQKHSVYDVLPYMIWNNSKKSTNMDDLQENNFDENLDAQAHYDFYLKKINNPK